MRAALYDPTAAPPSMRLIDAPERPLSRDEVRIDVRAVSVSDFWLSLSPIPHVPGCNFAGEIIEVGPDVTDFVVGDHVTATTKGNGLAERAVAPVASLVPIDANFPFVDGAALLEGLIGTFLVSEVTDRLPPDRTDPVVAVHHDHSALGCAMAGLFRQAGIRAIGVSGAPMTEAEQLAVGFAAAIDPNEAPIEVGVLRHTDGGGVDALLDNRGTLTLDEAWRTLRPGGTLIRCSPYRHPMESSSSTASRRFAELGMSVVEFDTIATIARRFDEIPSRAQQFVSGMAAGDIVVPTTELPFGEVAQLPALLSGRTVVGRVVVTR